MYLNKEYWKKCSEETWPREKELIAELKKRIKGLKDIVEIDMASAKSVTEIQDLRAPVYSKYEYEQFKEIATDSQSVLEDAYEQLARAAVDCFNRYKLEEPYTAEQLVGWAELHMDPEEKEDPTVRLVCEVIHPSIQPHLHVLSKNPDCQHHVQDLLVLIDTIAKLILFDRPSSQDELLLKLSDLFKGYQIKGTYIFQTKDRNLDITSEVPRRQRLNAPKKDGFYGVMNDKVVQTILANKPDAIESRKKLFRVPINKQTNVYLSIGYLGAGITTSTDITPTDISIAEAVSNLMIENGHGNFTALEIWKRERGIPFSSKANPGKAKLDEYSERIRKMAFTETTIDFSEEVKNKQIVIDDDKWTSGKRSTYFLKVDNDLFQSEKGKELRIYHFDEIPVLYKYNMMKHQIRLVSNELISIRPGRNETENTIPFRNYLLRQISWMKDKNGRTSNIILLSTMYKKLGIDPPEIRVNKAGQNQNGTQAKDPKRAKQRAVSKIRKADNEIITSILDELIKRNEIKGYTAEGRPVSAYIIEL